eukprot:1382362-Prorocentrum_lima.AAC.1
MEARCPGWRRGQSCPILAYMSNLPHSLDLRRRQNQFRRSRGIARSICGGMQTILGRIGMRKM